MRPHDTDISSNISIEGVSRRAYKMVNIPANFNSKSEEKCKCGSIENMSHIYECEIWSKNNQPKIEYSKIFNGNISEQILVYRRFRENMERRKICIEQSLPSGQIDPLLCLTVRDK